MSRSKWSRAQQIAQKHNGNCRRLTGSLNNLRSILIDCDGLVSPAEQHSLNRTFRSLEATIRDKIDEQYAKDGEENPE